MKRIHPASQQRNKTLLTNLVSIAEEVVLTRKDEKIKLRDITKFKVEEIELKKSNEQLQAVFKGFPIPSYIWQRTEDDFILIDHNNAAEVFTRGLIKKLRGIRFSKMYENSPYKQSIESDLLKCFNEKITVNHLMPCKLRNTDDIKKLKVCYVFVPPDLILVHTEDITSKIVVKENLKMLSNAVEQTADSVVITNDQGIIQYVNPAFTETTGFRADEALGRTPRILKSDKQDETFYKKLWKTILNENSYKGTIINRKKNGELYWSQQTITPMKDKAGKIPGFLNCMIILSFATQHYR